MKRPQIVADDRNPNYPTLAALKLGQEIHTDTGWHRVRAIRRGPFGIRISLEPLEPQHRAAS